MSDDLVTRLRGNVVSQKYQLEAAACIEWLQSRLRLGDDLVRRLRELERDLLKEGEDLSNAYYIPTIGEAADEIERLREIVSRMEAKR